MELGRIIAHIPARGGSKRVPSKNLRLMNGKPMIQYAVEAAKQSAWLDEVYINTDSEEIADLGRSLDCSVYLRSKELGSDTASGDDFTYDFIQAMKPDTLVLINPVCPLIENEDIDNAISAFENSNNDTLISCSVTQMQTFMNTEPVNVRVNEPLKPSQDNPIVQICNWAITIWNAPTFCKLYEANGSGYFGENRLLFPISGIKSVKVSKEEDFNIAEALLIVREKLKHMSNQPEFWKNPSR